VSFTNTLDHFAVKVAPLEERKSNSKESEGLIRSALTAMEQYVKLNKSTQELLLSISHMRDEGKLADTIIPHLAGLKVPERQEMLEMLDVSARLEKVIGYIHAEMEVARTERRIRARVKKQMERSQKEYYLNEQMAAIQKELGEKDGKSEWSDFESKIKSKNLTPEARERAQKELRKLKSMQAMSAESTVVRNYLDVLLSLPWKHYSDEQHDILAARETLDADHFGLEKVKERILDFLSIRMLVPDSKGPILCLVGPPGVGKTSLAKSVADATGRKFVRVSLGGVRDEAEIRGHRRTYIGSMPGKILNAIKKAGTSNPVVLLDEIDKMGSDNFRGDPTAAMLEVLDPEQNSTFVDHYLDMEYDLSKVLFIATANSTHNMSSPLLDRMEIVRLSGYTEEEKMAIARQYLLPKQIKNNGLEGTGVTFTEDSLRSIIRFYTREGGVRSLEREIASVLRKSARAHLEKYSLPNFLTHKCEDITSHTVETHLGPPKYRIGTGNEEHQVGICTGLAWTEVGGDILMIEVATMPGTGKLTITGKLGDVMQESAQAALSYVRSRAPFLGLEDGLYQKLDVHIHVPEGAIPKDGPSAGIAMATALTSALAYRPVSKDIAMTGEITLRGGVLPIGGLKEKILAAHRSGIKKVLIPKDNVKDLKDIPAVVLNDIEVVAVEHMDTVLLHALVWKGDDEVKDELYTRLSGGTPILMASTSVV
jgi:ATP-dependent Lon protease